MPEQLDGQGHLSGIAANNDDRPTDRDAAADIVVYTLGWKDAGSIEKGEQPGGLLHSRVVVNGVELRYVNGIRVQASGDDFARVQLDVVAGGIRFVALTAEEFKQPLLP